MSRARPGEIYIVRTIRGRFAACQVVSVDAKHADIVALDWLGDRPPRLEELDRARPLVLTHHAWAGVIERINVEPDVPDDFEPIGEAPLVVSPDSRSRGYSGWSAIPLQVEAQYQWDHELPDDVIAAYRVATSNRGEHLELDLGGGDVHTLPADAWRLRIDPGTSSSGWHLSVPADAAIRWEVLNALGALTEIEYSGRDPGFAAWVSSRRLMQRAAWYEHGQSRIDLSASSLNVFGCGNSGEALELLLPDGIRSLSTSQAGDDRALHAVHPREGEGLHLELAARELRAVPEGLPRLSRLTVRGLRRADCASLVGFSKLLRLELVGAPGELLAPDALLRLPELRELALRDFYAGELASLPDASAWPRLRRLELRGLRATDAALLRKRLKGISRLEIAGAKSDAWIRENLENPFRDWIDGDPALGKAACTAWKQARVALRKLGPGASRKQVEPVLEAFNRLECTHGLDTIQREEVCDAFDGLCLDVQGAIDEATADELLDRLREF